MCKESDYKKKCDDLFESFKTKEYTQEDIDTVLSNESTIESKIQCNNLLSKYLDTVKLFFSMIKDTVNGTYKGVPKVVIAVIIATLLYVISWIDIIPDAIPIAGILDDALLLSLCIGFANSDIKKYREWKENQSALIDAYKEEY